MQGPVKSVDTENSTDCELTTTTEDPTGTRRTAIDFLIIFVRLFVFLCMVCEYMGLLYCLYMVCLMCVWLLSLPSGNVFTS